MPTATATTPKPAATRTVRRPRPAAKTGNPQTDRTDATREQTVINGVTGTATKRGPKPVTTSRKPGTKAARTPRTTARAPKPGVTKTVPAPKGKTAPAPKTEVQAAKRDAKQDLARRVIMAASTVIEAADGSEAFMSCMTKAEAAECVAQWIHHLPGGRENGKRWWGGILPRPNRSDWR